MHLTDLMPDRPGLEVFDVHEDKSQTYCWDIHDAATGEVLLKGGPDGVDNGRGLTAQVAADYRGFFFSSAADNQSRSCVTGEVVSEYGPTINNYRIYWDGDLQDELLGDISRHNQPLLEKWNGNGYSRMYPKRDTNLYSIGNSMTCNGTKGTPCLQADILGDWREEIIFYDGADPSKINIFTTNMPSAYRVPTLMHDHVYRMGIAWQNVAYNQPPHLGYYLPDLFAEPEPDPDPILDTELIAIEDYESATDASSWVQVYGGNQSLELASDDGTHGNYITHALSSANGGRACYTKMDYDFGAVKQYVYAFDAALTPGNGGTSELAVMTQGGSIPTGNKLNNNFFSVNNPGKNFLLTVANTANNSNVYMLNGDAEQTVTLPRGGWCHYELTVDIAKRTVDYKITNEATNEVLAKGTFKPADGTSMQVQGLYMVDGRYYGTSCFDNLQLLKVVPSEVAVAIGSEGISTFSSQYALDFSKSSVAAFVVNNYQNGWAKLSPVSQTAAGEGIVVQGTPGTTVNVPITKDNVSSNSDNLLHGVTTANGYTVASGKSIFVLAKKSKGVGFYRCNAGIVIPEGRAYLVLPDESRDFIGFDGTGIDITAIEQADAIDDGQQQPVAKIAHRVYIYRPVKGGKATKRIVK